MITISDIRASAWNEGEQPVEFPPKEDWNAIQYWIMEQLGTKEYGKVGRIYPPTSASPGEITLLYRAFTDPVRGRQIVSGTDEKDLTANFEARKRECGLKVFTPAELYALKPTRVDYDSHHTISVHLGTDLGDYWGINTDEVGKTKRFETRTLVDHNYDGRRGWTLQTVWFDGKPVMVINSSGRDGDEYHDRWITDDQAFGDLVRFLRSFIPEEQRQGFASASTVIPAMTEFYGHTIHDYYEFEP